jgi:hypothetical protein
MGLWIEIRKWLKELKLESTIDVSPFTEEDLQRAGMKADVAVRISYFYDSPKKDRDDISVVKKYQ